jgi:hypothetical protein
MGKMHRLSKKSDRTNTFGWPVQSTEYIQSYGRQSEKEQEEGVDRGRVDIRLRNGWKGSANEVKMEEKRASRDCVEMETRVGEGNP